MKQNRVLSLETGEFEQICRQWPGIFPKSPYRWITWISAGIIVLALFFTGLIVLEFSLVKLVKGSGKLFGALSFMFPPSSGGYFNVYFHAILETVAMAFLGSLLSSIAAVPLGFLGAKNIISNTFIHVCFRRLFDFVRALDPLIWALIFVNAVGLGPLAGILAIAVNDTGTLSKLFAEAIENADYEQIKGVKATGANSVQVVAFAYMPQIIPIMLSNSLFFFEANVRSATILGVVGAGGIGMYLVDRLRVLEWQQASFIILLILVTVVIIDYISRMLRLKFIGKTSFL